MFHYLFNSLIEAIKMCHINVIALMKEILEPNFFRNSFDWIDRIAVGEMDHVAELGSQVIFPME